MTVKRAGQSVADFLSLLDRATAFTLSGNAKAHRTPKASSKAKNRLSALGTEHSAHQ